MPLLPLAALFAIVTLACAAILLMHAFRRSVGTGMMVLLIPCYMPFYAFSQFEHPRKNVILACFFGASLLAAVLLGLGVHAINAAELQSLPAY